MRLSKEEYDDFNFKQAMDEGNWIVDPKDASNRGNFINNNGKGYWTFPRVHLSGVHYWLLQNFKPKNYDNYFVREAECQTSSLAEVHAEKCDSMYGCCPLCGDEATLSCEKCDISATLSLKRKRRHR